MSLLGGRFIAAHGFVTYDPLPTVAQGGTWLNQQWLAQVAFFHNAGALGQTGLTVIYALVLALPLALLLWLCRRKGLAMLVAITAIYFPGLLAVIHPPAAGFTVLAFSLLVVPDRGRLASGAGGLLLIALVTVGLAIEHRRGVPGTASPWLVAVLGLIGVMAAAVVSVASPLGGAVWSYILSFQNSAIDHASQEWRSALPRRRCSGRPC